jgi:hypothetical protein
MNTKFSMYLNLGVAGLQIYLIVMFGAWPSIFMFAANYTLFWWMFRQYKREKAKEWYASILAAQRRAQFPQRMRNCIGMCDGPDDYVRLHTHSIKFACKICGLVE